MSYISFENIRDAESVEEDVAAYSLESLLRQAFTEDVAGYYQDKMEVLQKAKDPVFSTDPENIYQFQLKSSEYNIQLSLYSTLARKAVTAVDTLIRA